MKACFGDLPARTVEVMAEKMAWAVENEGKHSWQTGRKQAGSREAGNAPEAQRTQGNARQNTHGAESDRKQTITEFLPRVTTTEVQTTIWR